MICGKAGDLRVFRHPLRSGQLGGGRKGPVGHQSKERPFGPAVPVALGKEAAHGLPDPELHARGRRAHTPRPEAGTP